MKLKNKKTGEVLKIYPCIADTESIKFMGDDGEHYEYKSLAEFNKFWEDAPEEPKSYWFINTACDEPIIHVYGEPYEMQKETGNHFETREDAERAYEKLKAWKFGGGDPHKH